MSTDEHPVSCTVYRCAREREMYIYVRQDEGLTRIPDELKQMTGELIEVLTLELHPARRLARVKVEDVLQAVADKGYFLQLPPDKQATRFTLGE